jgi:hypothetical protein
MKEQEASNYPKFNKFEGGGTGGWGEFAYEAKMRWGPWQIEGKPTELFKSQNVTVLECFASEAVQDEQGYVAERTLENDPCLRHFLVGLTKGKGVLWWHNVGEQGVDLETKRCYEASIKVKENEIVVIGYGRKSELENETHINIETGNITYVPIQGKK